MRAPIAVALLVVACGPAAAVITSDDSSATGSADSAPSGSTSAATVDTGGDDPSTTIDPDADSGVGDDGSGFIRETDAGGVNFECDIWIDDCPLGQKCMPWDNQGGNSWNATKCTPLADEPRGVGEQCSVEGNAASGIDDCGARAVCSDVDPETNMGTCFAMCTGSDANPSCADPCTFCPIYSEGVSILCQPVCDPLLQLCGEGQACYPGRGQGVFTCVSYQSQDMGALGDPCDFFFACDPGFFCAYPNVVPDELLNDCGGATGCCTAFCDATAAQPCPQPGLETAECIPWFDEGEAPPCFAGVIGACVLPE